MKSILLLAATLFVSVAYAASPTTKRPNIDQFRREAERLIGRPIRVIDVPPSSTNDGSTTYDDPTYVQIALREGLPEDVRLSALAHELGHIVLKATRHITSGERTSAPNGQHDQGLMDVNGGNIANCYVDPLADAEAAKRGFNPQVVVDQEADNVKRLSPDRIRSNLRADALFQNFYAVHMYCLWLRPHSFDLDDLRRVFLPIEPAIDKKLWELRKLGNEKCSTPEDCFTKTKKLRDVAGFSGLIFLKNPHGNFE